MNATLNEQIAPEIIQAIISQATARGVSVNDYLRQALGLINGVQSQDAGEDEFMKAMESMAEDVPPLPRDFSREDIYFPKD
jgi:hypothetical protein